MSVLTSANTRAAMRWILTLAGTAGIAAVFLPFTYGVSPLAAIAGYSNDDFFLSDSIFLWMALPFLLSFPVTALWTWRLVAGRTSRTGAAIAWCAAALALLASAALLAPLLVQAAAGTVGDFGMVIGTAVLMVAAVFLMRSSRRTNPAMAALLAMQLAYLPNACFVLVVFHGSQDGWGGWDAGAYVTLAAVLVYLVHIAFEFRSEPADGGTGT